MRGSFGKRLMLLKALFEVGDEVVTYRRKEQFKTPMEGEIKVSSVDTFRFEKGKWKRIR